MNLKVNPLWIKRARTKRMREFTRPGGKSNFKREQIKKRNARPDRGGRLARAGEPSLRDDIARIDQDILRLLLKRHNMAEKIRQKGRMPAADEKFLREKWQESVARISKDPDLSSRFFALLQDISFLPKPAGPEERGASSGEARRSAFAFAPAGGPLDIVLQAPDDTQDASSWAYMAACAGQALRLESAPDNSPFRNCVNSLGLMGAKISREQSLMELEAGAPIGRPDKVLHAGVSGFNFYLYLAHYLGRASRVKITGEAELGQGGFSALSHFLPKMGARMVHVVPRSASLPVRLECSGLLPESVDADPALPPEFYEALILACPFYERPLTIDFKDNPAMDAICGRSLPILEQCGALFSVDGPGLRINPSKINIPQKPRIGMDPELAGFILLLPEAAGGSAELKGFWPDWPECGRISEIFQTQGLDLIISPKGAALKNTKPLDALKALPARLVQGGRPWEKAMIACLAACASLRGAEAGLPWPDWPECDDFLRALGLFVNEEGRLSRLAAPRAPFVWNAPSAFWALALAVCALARSDRNPGMLGNPGIVSEIWIPFWTWYNNLLKKGGGEAPAPEEPKKRRRILTEAEAALPELKEEEL